MKLFLTAFLLGFFASMVIAPLVFYLARKLKAQQKILHYVKEHSGKEGTPTFGGLIFIFGLLIASLFLFYKDTTMVFVTLGSTLSFGLLGFLDDFIKVKFKQNLGLKAYQKLIGQIGISIILGFFVYNYIGTELYIPFTLKLVDFGAWIIPLTVFVFLALVNSVNLIDGLDGLSSSTSLFYLLGITAFVLIFKNDMALSTVQAAEIGNLTMLNFVLMGALCFYLCVNVFPAKIFMGDTGSLALGGFLTAISVFYKLTLLIPILGLIFVLTALSDIIQVGVYKLKKKRVFKMAPLHHHFQMSGIHENKIVLYYSLITLFLSIVNILLTGM